MSLAWLIVGGGIHGVHLAARLLGEAGVAREQLRIVDPGDRLLARWRECTATTGMSHLRSPSVHHLDLEPFSLRQFARRRKRKDPGIYAPPYDRPSLELFNDHCDKVVDAFRLEELHIRDHVATCQIGCDGIRARLASGLGIEAQNVVLAIGAGEQPEWPDWAPRGHPRVQHVYATGFDGWPSSSPETVVVIGGGISACQVALRLHDEGHRVHVVSRHGLRQHQFDSDPGWLGPKFMAGFDRERDLDRRRALIAEARHRGSVPPEVRRAIHGACRKGHVHWHEDGVLALDVRPWALELRLASGTVLDASRVLLATGFATNRPGGALVDELIASASLPCARCGYPVVDATLRWHPRVYVSGPLAELELGPAARNIAGARRAGDRLVGAVRREAPLRGAPAR